jgi:hypothetical protein
VLARIVGVVVVVLLASGSSSPGVATLPSVPVRAVGPEAIFTPGVPLKNNPVGTLATLQRLGVDRVRVFLPWSEIAPDSTATTKPAFDATDPGAYPPLGWQVYDTIVRDTLADHMGLDMVLGPPPPRWASGKGAPQPAQHTYWRPNATDFAQFVQAVGTRYSGHYTPPGASSPLPAVRFWSVWNEPNLGVQLAPQAIDDSKVEVSSMLYRRLVDAAWTGLHASGHGHDTILIGELAPAGRTVGTNVPGNFAQMTPLRFLRAMYCVGSNDRLLTGTAATLRGCPATAAGSARFRARNPGLFQATAYADHPYPQGLPPDEPTPDEPDFTELADIGHLFSTLDTLQRVYGSHKRFDVYSTEFGYQTTPPDVEAGTVSPALAAEYLNWSEYLSWRQPRLVSYDQYLLVDAPLGNFATGIETSQGVPKPGFYAYRMPLYLPVTATAAGHPLEVWGCVRPAGYARRLTHRAQHVAIQFATSASGPFTTRRTVTITDPHGYFDVPVTFPGTGFVRLTWSYPGGPAISSRTVHVTVG